MSSQVLASTKSFKDLSDEFLKDHLKRHPTAATFAGVHQYDDILEDYSKSGIEIEKTSLKKWKTTFAKVNRQELTIDEASDLDLIMNSIQASLLELQEIKMWQKNPDHYSSSLTSSVFSLMSRSFASQDERLKSIIARERKVSEVFKAARENLKNPPRVYTEVAIEQIEGIVSFFEKDVPLAFSAVKDAKLLEEFQKTNQSVISELSKYKKFLTEELLAKSKGDFRLGEKLYMKKLKFEEMVELSKTKLLEIGFEDLRRNQKYLNETIHKIDPKRSFEEVFRQIVLDYPAPEKLIDTVKSKLDGLREFLIQKNIISVPSKILPIVQETPPFLRALTFASMDTPGPFETKATEAFYNITLPEKSWPKKRIDEHMEQFSHSGIISTSIHEAYPGHYIQFLWVKNALSPIRQIFGANTNAEGWAHYTEQMMLDEGYGKGDLKLRVGQLHDALWRNCRYIVGIKMHAGEMTFDEGVKFFEKEGHLSHANAVRETKRGTSDPTYLYYTLGKLQIYKLREDYRKIKGSQFSLKEFHDSFMRQGFPPIKIVRKALLGTSGDSL